MGKIINILVADDEPKARLGLRLLLERESGLKIVGEAAEAASLLVEMQAGRPDLLLLDWELPGLWQTNPGGVPPDVGHRQVQALRDLSPRLKVIALSGRPEARQLALAAGVDGFMSKCDPPERLLITLRELYEQKYI